MDLLECQQGLCAYTEQLLCGSELLEPACWKAGRYNSARPATEAQLDHFDPRLKVEQQGGKRCQAWLWDNLFAVHDTVNRKKGKRLPNPLMKPDSLNYNPFQLLSYSIEFHSFGPNAALDEEEQRVVDEMLDLLQVNAYFVRIKREAELEPYKRALEYGLGHEGTGAFPTAIEFLRREATTE